MHNAAAVLVAITVLLGVLATTAVGLRLFCRYLQKMPAGLDDYLIIIALVWFDMAALEDPALTASPDLLLGCEHRL